MFFKHLQQTMRTVLPPSPVYHGKTPVYVPSNLASTGFVYVRNDAHCHPLQRPYDGPYSIINTNDKFYTLDIKGRSEKVSVDRLNAAFVTPLTTSEHTTVVSPGPQDPPVFSRGGHVPHVVSPGAQVPPTSPRQPLALQLSLQNHLFAHHRPLPNIIQLLQLVLDVFHACHPNFNDIHFSFIALKFSIHSSPLKRK